jgi:uncharacterized membrane protein
MATETPTPGGGSTNLGLDPKIAGLLCYVPCCIGLIFSVVAAIVEKQSRFVRFHAFQSLLLQGAAIVALVGLQVVVAIITSIGIWVLSGLIWIVQILVGVALLGLLIVLMIKANAGEEMELPVIGPMARQWV